MRGSTMWLAGFGLAVAVGGLAAAPGARAEADVAETYYGCPAGFSFQSKNGSAARCYKAGATQTASTLCPPGTTKSKDVINNTDQCVGPAGVATVTTGCTPPYTKKIQSGWDVCQKVDPPQIQAPSVQVSL